MPFFERRWKMKPKLATAIIVAAVGSVGCTSSSSKLEQLEVLKNEFEATESKTFAAATALGDLKSGGDEGVYKVIQQLDDSIAQRRIQISIIDRALATFDRASVGDGSEWWMKRQSWENTKDAIRRFLAEELALRNKLTK
jgi:hypothetical protein